MKKSIPAPNPAAYVSALSGWQRVAVEKLRAAVITTGQLDEVIKWGNLVYLHNGPAIVIRAEEHRVVFGFWRGKRLRHIEPSLKPGGKYEMASLVLHEDDAVDIAVARRLTEAAVALNEQLGDPTDI
jgi:hypothetical protein